MKYLLIELIKFLKNNIKKLAIGTILIASIFLVVSFSGELKTQVIEESISDDKNDFIVTEARPAYFQFYAETSTGEVFSNNHLIEDFFTSPNILHIASLDQDENIFELVDQNENTVKVNYNNSGEAKIISVYSYSDSNLIEISVNIGNEDKNLSLLNFYYDLIVNGEVPFLENKELTLFQIPKIKEIDPLDRFIVEESQNNYPLYLDNLIISVLAGFIVSVSMLVLFNFYSRKLKYFPSYSLMNIDFFILFDKKIDNGNIIKDILTKPLYKNTVVLKQANKQIINESFCSIFNKSAHNNNLEVHTSLLDINDLSNLNRLIIVIEEGITDRNWYNNQLAFLKNADLTTVVIQVNLDK